MSNNLITSTKLEYILEGKKGTHVVDLYVPLENIKNANVEIYTSASVDTTVKTVAFVGIDERTNQIVLSCKVIIHEIGDVLDILQSIMRNIAQNSNTIISGRNIRYLQDTAKYGGEDNDNK